MKTSHAICLFSENALLLVLLMMLQSFCVIRWCTHHGTFYVRSMFIYNSCNVTYLLCSLLCVNDCSYKKRTVALQINE